MKKISLYILSYISALFASIIGLIFNSKWASNTVLIVVLVLLTILPIFLFVFNIFSAKRFVNKIKRSKVADMNAFLVSHRDDAENTAKRKLKELRRTRHLTTIYTFFIVSLAIASSVLGGILIVFESSLYVLCLLYSGLLFYSVYTRIHRKKQITLSETAVAISKNDYPLIYDLARKAADRVGSTDEILILLNWNCSASIIKDKKRSILQLGVILLHTLSEEELYNILLHEFAHVSDDNRKAFRESQYHTWLCEESEGYNKLSVFLSKLYLIFATKYAFNYMFYDYASSVVNELYADQTMAKHGDPKVAVSALLKTHYDTMYFWESCVKNEPSLYEPEELKADYLTNRISDFKKAISERSEYWNELVSKEILANNATHPTLKMRMNALGIQDLSLTDTKSSDEYIAECQKLLEFSENIIYEERLKTYKNDRSEQFVQPLARIEEWHQAGNPISPETYADLVSDLKTIGKHEEAEVLCDKAIEALPSLSSAHATFMKGSAMLYRYDERGMELIYRAMEQNGNYIEEGLNIIGNFCCLTGREEALLDYRKKAGELAQKHLDQDSQISFLSKNDNLTKETLPNGMLEEILAYIKSIDQDIIQNIYLVRKTVSDTFFASVFIIHFYGGTDAQRDEIMHKIFRFLDSHPTEWQFSLFDYFQYPEIKVEKIEGSLVFSKENNKEKI